MQTTKQGFLGSKVSWNGKEVGNEYVSGDHRDSSKDPFLHSFIPCYSEP